MSERPFRTYRLSELQSLAEKQIAGVYGPESDATTALHLIVELCERLNLATAMMYGGSKAPTP